MTQLVRLKRSATPAKVPLLSDVDLGEVAINTYDGRVFTKRDNGTPAIIELLTSLGGTLTGFLTLHADPTADLHAATKQYVDGLAISTQGSDIAASSNTTYTINLDDGEWRKITFTSSCTLAFTFPSSQVNSLVLEMVNAGAYTIAWPAGIKWNVGVAPSLTAAGTDLVVIMRDGNGNYYGSVIAQAVA